MNKKGIHKGGENYWYPKTIYWETIYKYLDTQFLSIEYSTTNFWPSTVQEIRNNAPTKSSHEVMETYLRENSSTIEDCYVGPLCNKPKDPFSPMDDAVGVQILIVQSPKQDCVILLGRENGSVYRDPNATIESYKVEVQLWKPTRT